jgi:hypothetical protein
VERFNLKKLNDMAIKELLTSWNLKQVSIILILGHQWGMMKYCDSSTSPDDCVAQLRVLEVRAASTIMAEGSRSGGQQFLLKCW